MMLAAGLTTALLTWSDPNPPGVVESFNVYWKSGAEAGKWTRVANVKSTNATVTLYGERGVFTVTASNATGEVWMVRTNEVTP